MSIGTGCPAKENRDLFLNERPSDVTIVVEGAEFPAHRNILVQRCEYFKTMFESGMIESTSNRIEIHETSVECFKSVLEWIYTGTVQFTSVDHVLEALRLAQVYNITELVNLTVDCLKHECTVGNVCYIVNEAVLLSLNALTAFSLGFICKRFSEIIKRKSFKMLSLDALGEILMYAVIGTPPDVVFHAVLYWMKTNPSKYEDFPDIVKLLPLKFISIKKLKAFPTTNRHTNVLFDLAREHREKMDDYTQMPNENIALPKFGIKVISGGETSFFEKDNAILKHKIELPQEGILIDLGHCFMINSIKMQLVDNAKLNYFFWISVSSDNYEWTRVVDYSEYIYRGLQELYFEPQLVRYIRICGSAPINQTFKISRFEALYTMKPFEIDAETGLLIPSTNVASLKKGAVVIKDNFKFQQTPLASTSDKDPSYIGYMVHNLGNGEIILQLPQAYLLDTMTLLLHNKKNHVFSYIIDVSVDKMYWNQVFWEFEVTGKRDISFDSQPVVFVKITSIYCSPDFYINRVYFECFAKTLLETEIF
uniref:BTB domain-containing protein n=2 Tax=Panagrellus redivivus TaxID=6233 RepID=A0A7E4V2W7_PANRE